jgi:CMP-N-acetylneuraminic acid synthetase
MSKTSTIAVITARGGSKGLPRKNIKPLCGKPLIAWTIEHAHNSAHIDRTIVSTDDEEIAEIATRYGADVPFLRPTELARDDSPSIDAILHAITWLEETGEYYDLVMLLQPTSPLRKKSDLDDAITLLTNNIDHADSLVSVGEVHQEHPSIVKKVEGGYVKPFIRTGENVYQRQQLSTAYFPYGVVYLSKTDALKKHKTFYQERTLPYVIERWQTYEIDDIYDFMCIEAIAKHDAIGARTFIHKNYPHSMRPTRHHVARRDWGVLRSCHADTAHLTAPEEDRSRRRNHPPSSATSTMHTHS